MNKCKAYVHMRSNDYVWEDEAQKYAFDKLGIKVTPLGRHGEYTQEQIENAIAITEWYFSGEWIVEELDVDNIPCGYNQIN